MTGNRRNRAIAVTLSLVMVLSMAGMAAFAGTAAATSASAVDGDVQATPADDDATDAAQVAVLELDPSQINSAGEVVFNTSDTINITDATGTLDYGDVTDSDVYVEFVDDSNSVKDTLEGGTDDDITTGTAQTGAQLNINHAGTDVDLQDVKYIRVVIESGVDNGGSGTITNGLEVAYEESGGSDVRVDNIDLNLDGDAPIQVDDSGALSNHTSLERAVNSIGGGTATVTIQNSVDEFYSQPAVLDGAGSATSPAAGEVSAASVGQNDVEIKGNDNEVKLVNSAGGGITEALNLGGNDNPVVENVQFNSTARINSHLTSGVITGDASAGNYVNVSSNQFEDFSGGPVVDASGMAGDTVVNVTGNTILGENSVGINVGQVGANSQINENDLSDIGSNSGIIITTVNADLDILNNNISDVDSNPAIDVTANGNHEVNINAGSSSSDDAIRTSGGANAIVVDANGNDPRFNVNDTEIIGETSAADTGIDVTDSASGDQTAFIGQGTVVSNYNTSVAAAASLDSATITVTGGTTLDGLEGDGTPINAIDATNAYSSGLTLNVDDTTIKGDADTTGISVNDGNTPSNSALNFDTSNAGSTLEGVGTGVDLQSATPVSDISNTTFTNVSSTAINIQADASGLTIEDITVDGQSSDGGTGIAFGGANALTVLESSLGVSNSEEVNDGVSVSSRAGEIVVNNTDIYVDSGNAISVTGDDGNPLTIDGTSVFGDDQTGTGIYINDASLNGLNVNPDTAGTITAVDTGIDLQDTAGARTLGSGVDIDNYGTTGINDASGNDLTVSGAELTEADNAGATGLSASAGGVATVNSETTIEVADNSGSTGVLVNTGGNVDIQKSTITAKSTQSDGTAIDLDSITTTVTISLNNIEGFNTSSGLGLDASDASTGLDDEEATGNWWGSEYGPDADAGSSVSSGVAAEVYDPFLTADLSTQVNNAEDADSVSALATSDVQEFAHGLTVGEGESFAFPATSTDTQISDLYTDNSSNVAIYEFNASSQSWELASDRPTGLDAYVASFGDDGDSINVKIEYESQSSGVDRGTYEYQQGFNYLPVAQENTGVGTSVISATFGFDLADPSNQETRFASQYSGAANDIYSQSSYATVRGDNLGSPSPDLSPFQGTFVYVNTTVTDDQIAPLDPSVNLDNADNIDEPTR